MTYRPVNGFVTLAPFEVEATNHTEATAAADALLGIKNHTRRIWDAIDIQRSMSVCERIDDRRFRFEETEFYVKADPIWTIEEIETAVRIAYGPRVIRVARNCYDAVLSDWAQGIGSSSEILVGTITGDRAKRFEDGTVIHTSKLLADQKVELGRTVRTLNSRYLLGEPRKEISRKDANLMAFLGHAPVIPIEGQTAH